MRAARGGIGSVRDQLPWIALGLSGVGVVWSAWRSPIGLLVGIPAIAACVYVLRQRRSDGDERVRLEQLVDTLQTAAQTAPQLDIGITELLASARRLFHAEYAEILVLPATADEPVQRNVSRTEGEMSTTAGAVTDDDRLALETLRRRGYQPVVVAADGNDPLGLAAVLESRGLRDGLIGILDASRHELGLAIVGNLARVDGAEESTDATVFATFCKHASVVLEITRLGRSLDELMELKERLHYQAFHDALTGLPNRVLFAERVAEALDRARSLESDAGPTVLLLDIDDFKIINDTLGHTAGDDLLVAVADRLRQAVRPADTPARLGGDEFAILLDDWSANVGEITAERVAMAFSEPVWINEQSIVVRSSVGIAVAEPGMSAEQLLRNADAAMYEAKADEVRHVASYEAKAHEAMRRRRELRIQLDGALEHHQLQLRFQPVVSLDGGAIEAFEALVRWAHPEYGVVSPGDFLPVAENRQLAALGKHVMREACRHAFLWQGCGSPGRRVGIWINLSAVDLTSETLVEDMTRNLEVARLDPTVVTLEITETSVIVGEATAIANVELLRKLGVRVAIDDFGTGYSSLSRLGEFPLDMLKIPAPFVDRLSHEKADVRLVNAIVQLANSLGLGVVAEGVEREVQAQVLRQLGCELAQGYLYAPAIDGENVVRLLQSGLSLPQSHAFGAKPSLSALGESASQRAA